MTPFVAINWAVLASLRRGLSALSATWSRLGHWFSAVGHCDVDSPTVGALDHTTFFVQIAYFFAMSCCLSGPLRIGLPLLVACVGVWLGMHTIQKLPLVHVFIEDSSGGTTALSVGAWCCIAWPLISQDPLAGSPTLAQRHHLWPLSMPG